MCRSRSLGRHANGRLSQNFLGLPTKMSTTAAAKPRRLHTSKYIKGQLKQRQVERVLYREALTQGYGALGMKLGVKLEDKFLQNFPPAGGRYMNQEFHPIRRLTVWIQGPPKRRVAVCPAASRRRSSAARGRTGEGPPPLPSVEFFFF